MNYTDTPIEGSLAGLSEYIRQLTILGQCSEDHPAGGKFVVVPPGYSVQRLAPAYEKPAFVAAHPMFVQVDSFTRYINDFKVPSSRIFADLSTQAMTAILDYHAGTEAATVAHRAGLNLRHSPAWDAWAAINGRAQDQVTFANFIEENADSIAAPAAADLLEMVENFQDHRTVVFQSKINRANGMMKIAYAEEDNSKDVGTVKIPERLTLNIAIYEGEAPEEVHVFIRTNTREGKLHITAKLHKVVELKRDAFTRIVNGVETATATKVAFGEPGHSPASSVHGRLDRR